MEMPKLGPQHIQLARLAGNWSGEEKMSPSPWEPKGYVATGRVRNVVAVDGFAVVQDYEQVRDGKTCFRGHGVFTWNAAKKQNELFWTDSMGTPAQIFTGEWNGDVLTVTGEGMMGKSRCTFDVSGGSYRFTMEMSPDGAQWMTAMSGSYQKS